MGRRPQRLPNQFIVDTRSLIGGNAIDSIGDLSQDRTISVSTDGIQTDELDLSISPSWTGTHTFGSGINLSGSKITDAGKNVETGITSAKTLSASNAPKLAVVDTSSSSVTVTLPASPHEGAKFTVKKDVTANTLTVDRNGANIDGSASNISLGAEDESVVLVADGSGNWWVESRLEGGGTL